MATGPSKPQRKRERRRQERRKQDRRATRLDRTRPKKIDPALAAETIERIVPRRHLIMRSGDVLLERSTARGFAPMVRARDVYQLCVEGEGVLPERFASFDRGALQGEEIARRRKACLYYRDASHEPLFLLRDFR